MCTDCTKHEAYCKALDTTNLDHDEVGVRTSYPRQEFFTTSLEKDSRIRGLLSSNMSSLRPSRGVIPNVLTHSVFAKLSLHRLCNTNSIRSQCHLNADSPTQCVILLFSTASHLQSADSLSRSIGRMNGRNLAKHGHRYCVRQGGGSCYGEEDHTQLRFLGESVCILNRVEDRRQA